ICIPSLVVTVSPFHFSVVAFACDVGGFAAVALAATAGSPATAASPAVPTRNFRREISTLAFFSFPNETCDITNFLTVEVALNDPPALAALALKNSQPATLAVNVTTV